MRQSLHLLLLTVVMACQPTPAPSPDAAATAARTADACAHDSTWTEPVDPFRIYGNTWHVGPRGLGVFLITAPTGHVLIDGGVPGGAVLIEANLRTLDINPHDVKWILVSHAHCDHAGDVAALAGLTGAAVIAGTEDVALLAAGGMADPQYADRFPFPPVQGARGVADGEVLQLGQLTVRVHATPGHTRGNTTWGWTSCENERCLELVDVGSLSAPDYTLVNNPGHPTLIADYEASFAKVAGLRCDLALAPHPGMVDFWGRISRRDQGEADALLDPTLCRGYAESARDNFRAELARQAKAAGER